MFGKFLVKRLGKSKRGISIFSSGNLEEDIKKIQDIKAEHSRKCKPAPNEVRGY